MAILGELRWSMLVPFDYGKPQRIFYGEFIDMGAVGAGNSAEVIRTLDLGD